MFNVFSALTKMIRLNPTLIINEIILNNLFKKNIYTVNDFLQKKSSDLENVCNLPCKEIAKLKDDITIKYSSPFLDGYNIYLNRSFTNSIQTGILKLDRLLGGGLSASYIYELCGQSASGKTQLGFSFLLHIIITTKKDIIYIDTKNKFSVIRIKQILKNKYKLTTQEINAVLNKIHVYSILDIYSLITCLHSLKEKSEPIIIVDSLPALYLSFISFYKNYGLCYMNYICSILKYLCKKNATILITNLAVKNCDFTNKINADQLPGCNDFKPAIGKYWFHIPNTRLMITRTADKQHNMLINITKSVYVPVNEKCILTINNCGIV